MKNILITFFFLGISASCLQGMEWNSKNKKRFKKNALLSLLQEKSNQLNNSLLQNQAIRPKEETREEEHIIDSSLPKERSLELQQHPLIDILRSCQNPQSVEHLIWFNASLDINPLKEILESRAFENITTLGLRNSNIFSMEWVPQFFKKLRSLDLEDNHIIQIPADIKCLTTLNVLALSNNRLKNPKHLAPLLGQVKYFYIDNNPIKTFKYTYVPQPPFHSEYSTGDFELFLENFQKIENVIQKFIEKSKKKQAFF